MKLKCLLPEDVYKLEKMARQYTDIIPHLNYNNEHYLESLREYIASGIGKIFVFENDEGEYIASIGGVKYPDILTGELVAVELFWYSEKTSQGKGLGLTLLDVFEKWAKDSGCARVAMIYLPCSMPEKLHKLYEERGYSLREMHFEKEL